MPILEATDRERFAPSFLKKSRDGREALAGCFRRLRTGGGNQCFCTSIKLGGQHWQVGNRGVESRKDWVQRRDTQQGGELSEQRVSRWREFTGKTSDVIVQVVQIGHFKQDLEVGGSVLRSG